MSHPPSPRGPVVDDFFGTPVADPYRWLEEGDSPQTRAWTEAQNAHTERVLAEAPGRAAIEARLQKAKADIVSGKIVVAEYKAP